jgi:hypothetical protein
VPKVGRIAAKKRIANYAQCLGSWYFIHAKALYETLRLLKIKDGGRE